LSVSATGGTFLILREAFYGVTRFDDFRTCPRRSETVSGVAGAFQPLVEPVDAGKSTIASGKILTTAALGFFCASAPEWREILRRRCKNFARKERIVRRARQTHRSDQF
jgi:hypothetical protein